MTAHDDERRVIRDAMGRLLVGAPIRSDGKLTIKSLADEAGVKRWLLTHRHTDLQAEFRDLIVAHGAEPEPVRRLKDQVQQLQQETTRLRAELREAKATCALLERQIAVEALEAHARKPPGGSPGDRPGLRPVP